MVIKNAKIGDIENVALIELGEGDIQVAYTLHPGESKVCLCFKNDIKRPIGSSHKIKGKSTDEFALDAMLTFTTMESLEVVEKHLLLAKDKLKELFK